METPCTIQSLELENVKRVRALTLTPSPSGLTIIGGKNGQGKTSVLDAIAWALGGAKFAPTAPKREDGNTNPHLKVTLSNGIVVERKGAKSALTVTDPTGRRAGQQLLNSLIEELALDLPRFLAAPDREKASTLLRVIGVEDELRRLDARELEVYNRRLYVGQQQRQKAHHASELPEVPDAPAEEVSASELIARQQDILLRNARRQKARLRLGMLTHERESLAANIAELETRLDALREQLSAADGELEELRRRPPEADESTAELEADLRRVDAINRAVRTNAAKRKAEAEAEALDREYRALSGELETVRAAKRDLLKQANLPLPDLTVEDGALLYRGQRWDCMSGAEQLMVATAIVRRLNPSCRFVLMDRLEQMDMDTLTAFDRWLRQEGLQVIATRVSTGDECSVIIEDGLARPAEKTAGSEPASAAPAPAWKKGVF